jgi:hypothetical protein
VIGAYLNGGDFPTNVAFLLTELINAPWNISVDIIGVAHSVED